MRNMLNSNKDPVPSQKTRRERQRQNSWTLFLLILNLREGQFEVLDSMRSLADTSLMNCCNTLMTTIKEICRIRYPNSRKIIDNYQLIDIRVPQQTNKTFCGETRCRRLCSSSLMLQL